MRSITPISDLRKDICARAVPTGELLSRVETRTASPSTGPGSRSAPTPVGELGKWNGLGPKKRGSWRADMTTPHTNFSAYHTTLQKSREIHLGQRLQNVRGRRREERATRLLGLQLAKKCHVPVGVSVVFCALSIGRQRWR